MSSILLLSVVLGCSTDNTEAFNNADNLIKQGQLTAAGQAFDAIIAGGAKDNDLIRASVGSAYSALLQGNYEQADALLAKAIEAAAEKPSELSGLYLRRAQVAQYQKKYSQVQSFAEKSGLDAGKLFQAEVLMIDGDLQDAAEMLESISDSSVKGTAEDYLSLIESDDSSVRTLAEAQAAWALRDRRTAVQTMDGILDLLPENYAEEVLIWAGRAASVGELDLARSYISSMKVQDLPESQLWRVDATRAIIDCADGSAAALERCQAVLDQLDKEAPSKGAAHARITAALSLVENNPDAAAALIEGLDAEETDNAAAHVLWLAGQTSAAKSEATGFFARFLEH